MRWTCGPLLLAVAIGFLAPLAARAQALLTYDDFRSAQLVVGESARGGRWLTYEYVVRFANRGELGPGGQNERREDLFTRHPGFSTSNLSASRRIVGGQLQLRLESAGGTHPDPNVAPGYGRTGVMGLRQYQGNQNILQATVTPMAAEAPACRDTGESRVRAQLIARLLGRWYDADTVLATVSLERSSFGGDRIYGVLSRRSPTRPGVIEELRSVVFNRPWTLGRAHTLTIRYQPDDDEPANSQVIFTVAGGGMAAERRIMRRVPAASDFEASPDFDLRVETTPANCPAAGAAPAERIGVTMDARFDNIRIGDYRAGEQ